MTEESQLTPEEWEELRQASKELLPLRQLPQRFRLGVDTSGKVVAIPEPARWVPGEPDDAKE